MAVLFASADAPVEEFFYATPPRKVVVCNNLELALEALQGRQCKYVLVKEDVEVPADVEVRTRRAGFVLIQRRGQRTRSDRRALQRRFNVVGAGPARPYYLP